MFEKIRKILDAGLPLGPLEEPVHAWTSVRPDGTYAHLYSSCPSAKGPSVSSTLAQLATVGLSECECVRAADALAQIATAGLLECECVRAADGAYGWSTYLGRAVTLADAEATVAAGRRSLTSVKPEDIVGAARAAHAVLVAAARPNWGESVSLLAPSAQRLVTELVELGHVLRSNDEQHAQSALPIAPTLWPSSGFTLVALTETWGNWAVLPTMFADVWALAGDRSMFIAPTAMVERCYGDRYIGDDTFEADGPVPEATLEMACRLWEPDESGPMSNPANALRSACDLVTA